MYTLFEAFAPYNGILPAAKFTLRASLAFSYIGSVTARHSSSQRQPNFAAWYNGMQLQKFRPSSYSTETATYIPYGGHHFGHRPTF